MQAIFSELRHRLQRRREGAQSRSVSCGLGEGALAKELGELQARYPDLEIGSYPYFRRSDFGVTLVMRGTDRARLVAATEELNDADPRARRRPAARAWPRISTSARADVAKR